MEPEQFLEELSTFAQSEGGRADGPVRPIRAKSNCGNETAGELQPR